MNCLAGLPDEKLSVTFGLIVNNLSLSVERVIDGFLDLSQNKNRSPDKTRNAGDINLFHL